MNFDGRYEATEIIGSGGSGTVYRGRDQLLDREVAIKVLQDGHEPETQRRFLEEARLLASLQHPNIVPIYGYGRADNGSAWLVMPLLPGSALDYAEHGRDRAPLDVANFLLPVGQALDYCHRQGVVHRDLKPSNVHVTPQMRPIVMDFGIASRGSGIRDLSSGTPAYAAPETGGGERVGGAADQYSLAVLLFEMVTGTRPFVADEPLALRFQHENTPAPLASERRPDVPSVMDAALGRALSKEPGERFTSCEAFFEAMGVTQTTLSRTSLVAVKAVVDPERLQVLIVEDETTDFLIVERQLSRSDLGRFGCTQVRRLSELRDALTEVKPDVLLVDLGLPDSSGLSTLESVLEAAPDVPVVLQTGADEPELANRALRMGAQDFVFKGDADGRALARALLYAVDRHGLARGKHPDALRVRATGLLTRAALLDRVAMNLGHAERRGTAAVLGLLETADGSGEPAELLGKLKPWEGLGQLAERRYGFTTELSSAEEGRDRLRELIAGPTRWRVRMAVSPAQGVTPQELLKAIGL